MQVTWRSPSNIAIIKYWGKHGNQLPNNASLSLTLSNASTETSLKLLRKRSKKEIEVDFRFEGEKNPAFAEKITTYITSLHKEMSWLSTHRLQIHSSNSFPHSAGIASSASSMSALALCLLSTDVMQGRKLKPEQFFSVAGNYARLGSGSACRSVFPGFALWGKTDLIETASDKTAIPFPENYHPDFEEMQDSILIVHAGEKPVSSRAGHALMRTHSMADQRYANAHTRLKTLIQVLRSGDWETFCSITEAEALELHALMMTSDPSYILMRPNTLAIIEKIRHFRADTKIPLCFTLDAGPNVHVLYPWFVKKEVRNFIQSELLEFCAKKKVIYDQMGRGPVQVME
ncbi:MAG: diphosphomevalonate decarboxylase [Chitinophagales bacterium]